MSRLRSNKIDKIIRAISTLFIPIVLNVLAATLVHAAPNLSVQMDQPLAGVTLSAEGTSDWAHWGLSAATSFNHKSGVTQQISNYTLLGSTNPGRFKDSRVAYSWSGGTPTASASSSTTGIFFWGIGNGYRLTIPAQTSESVLKLYLGLWHARGRFEAKLSDGSVPSYVAYLDNSAGSVDRVVTLSFSAASSGVNLIIEYTLEDKYGDSWGNITLQAATLAYVHQITYWANSKAGAVSLTFDDGATNNYTLAVPALNARGFKGTFFIVSSFADGFAHYATWDEWRDAANQGHEIGSHTNNHPHLSTLSPTEMEDEIGGSKAVIDAQITTQKCLTFAYPYGDFINDDVKLIAQAYYITARGLSCDFNNPPYDFYNIRACEDCLSLAGMKAKADAAEQQGKWLITYHHSLDGTLYGRWTIDTLIEFLDYLETKDLWVGTYSSVTKYVKERESAHLFLVSSSNDQIVLNLTDMLDDAVYDQPLTIRSEVPSSWEFVNVQQGSSGFTVTSVMEGTKTVIYYNAIPDGGFITLEGITASGQLGIASLSPIYATVGGPSFMLMINGYGFVNGSTVRWNGSDRMTTFVSESQLSAVISAADISVAGTASVTVYSPPGDISNAMIFEIRNPPPPVATPSITPPGGTYTGSVAVTLATQTAGASIRYTTDGTEPTSGSTLYSGPITLTQSVVLRAKAFLSGYNDSATASASFTINPAGGSSLSVQMAQPSASVTLSSEGTSDWAHWGVSVATNFNHKSGVTQQISNYTLLGSTNPGRFKDSRVAYSWSGGTPTASASSSTTGIFFWGIGNGYRLTIPAQTSESVLKLYLGLWVARGRFEARLSDGSVSPYVTYLDNSTDILDRVVTLRFSAASSGVNLIIEYTLEDNYGESWGNITLQAATLVAGGSTLSVQMAQPSASVTLSSEGTSDWAHWGLSAATSFNHKSGVTQQISNYTLLGSTNPYRYSDSRVAYSWSGGTPTASATNSITGIFFTGIGNGYRLTIPAQTSESVLKLYLGLWVARGRFEARLSDGSVSPYVTYLDNSTDILDRVVTLRFSAASSGVNLIIEYTVENNYGNSWGNITLQAATLVAGQ